MQRNILVCDGDDDDVVDGSQQWGVVGVIGNARLGNDIVAVEDAVDVGIVAGIVAGDDRDDVVVVDGSQQWRVVGGFIEGKRGVERGGGFVKDSTQRGGE
jgi:hypothetical protein